MFSQNLSESLKNMQKSKLETYEVLIIHAPV